MSQGLIKIDFNRPVLFGCPKAMLVLLLLFIFMTGCGSSSSSNNNRIQCNPNLAGALALRSVPMDASLPQILRELFFTDPRSCTQLEAVTLNECGDFLSTLSPDQWSVDSNFVQVNSSAAVAELCFHKDGTAADTSIPLQMSSANQTATVQLQIQWTPQKIPDLFRWYKADSFKPATENLLVGQSTSRWSDYSQLPRFPGTAAAGREPLYKTSNSISKIQICGSAAGCTSVTQNQHLRIASSFAEFASSDLTVFYVVARKSTAVQYLLVNQSNGNNTGTFFGWISNTQFRMGLSGPGGSNQVTATIAPYSGTPQLEIWSGRLGTVSNVESAGLRIYRNHQELASNTSVTTQQLTATTIPYIGTQRSEHANANFEIAEVIIYKRALTSNERCQVDRYLSQKYNLTLEVDCSI